MTLLYLTSLNHLHYKDILEQEIMYTLYTMAISSTSWRARIALNLKQIKANHKFVALFNGQNKKPQYQKINPNMGIPSLILQDGTVLIESLPIIEYLNEVHPQPYNLFPGSAVKRAQVRGFCEIINSGIHPYHNLKLVNLLEKEHGVDKLEWAGNWICKGFTALQDLMDRNNKDSKYACGDEITCADVFLYPTAIASKNRWKVDMSQFPNINRVVSNLSQIKEFQDSEPQNQEDFQA